jgi:hypothetical protein
MELDESDTALSAEWTAEVTCSRFLALDDLAVLK